MQSTGLMGKFGRKAIITMAVAVAIIAMIIAAPTRQRPPSAA